MFNKFNSTSCNIPKNQPLGKPIYGIISFSNEIDSRIAIEQINGKYIDGYKVEMSYNQLRQRAQSAQLQRNSNEFTLQHNQQQKSDRAAFDERFEINTGIWAFTAKCRRVKYGIGIGIIDARQNDIQHPFDYINTRDNNTICFIGQTPYIKGKSKLGSGCNELKQGDELFFGSKDSEWEFISLEKLAQGVDLSKIEQRRRYTYG
ncbi:MAG: hypothetical protein EZS28_016970 [Streblomastix strix]|uniref:RRM domain-containing protein n=1 Tax=Streblomastix strix TaxID=222440 RepID=A0A5J4VZ36_9EUKA|nr:MAG: hypothetical protein EZS28_016967 [Streblomastix strix]KAA6387506.1 MAG: hypothetical protein EZS28_016970 [Streblomastix strix]